MAVPPSVLIGSNEEGIQNNGIIQPTSTLNETADASDQSKLLPSVSSALSNRSHSEPQLLPQICSNARSKVSTFEKQICVSCRFSEGAKLCSLPHSQMINARYVNPWPFWKTPHLTSVLKWKLFDKDESNVPSQEILDKTLPILFPTFADISRPPFTGIRVTWIGHASLLVQFDNTNILTDPIFSERASPLPFIGPKRYRQAALSVDDLPKIHLVVISHNHYDHLDRPSVISLNQKFPRIMWCVPNGMAAWMQQAGCVNVKEMDWWEEYCLPEPYCITVIFTPAQHWCKRSLNDDNKMLWGSWCILGPLHRFFFAGDTGYCPVFQQIGEVCGPFDLAAIPIGAYAPRWFMKYQHIDPKEAVQIHIDVKAKKSVGIHWGTFNLSYEPYLEPPMKLRNHLVEFGIPQGNFFTLRHGETKLIEHVLRSKSMDHLKPEVHQ